MLGCAPDSRVRWQLHGLKDCHTLCPDTGGPPRWAAVVRHNGVQGRLQQLGIMDVSSSNHDAQGATVSIHKEAPLAASLATIRRVRSNQVPPKRALPMATVCRLPFPVHTVQLSHPPPRLPTFGARHPVPPTSERCDGWCCRPQALSAIGSRHPLRNRKMMPLSIRRGSARLRPLALGGFPHDDGLDPFPKLVRHFPDGP